QDAGIGLEPAAAHILGEADDASQPLVDLRLGDERPAPALAHDQAVVHQQVERLPDGVPADPVPVEQFVLGGEHIAGLQFAAQYLAAEPLVQLVVERDFAVTTDHASTFATLMQNCTNILILSVYVVKFYVWFDRLFQASADSMIAAALFRLQ